MTDPQRSQLMAYWWPAACRAQGWKSSDKPLRLRVLSVAVSFPAGAFRNVLDCLTVINSTEGLKRELASATELNSSDDIDRVKALLLLLDNSITGAHEMDHREEGSARRSRYVIVRERLRCLALYPLEAPMGWRARRHCWKSCSGIS